MTPEIPERRVLLVFLDGVGIGTRDPRRNPFFNADIPFLRSLLGGSWPSLGTRELAGDAACVPVNVNMGVRGLPQSGTGQSALYTGVNTAKIIRQHFGPYLYSTLKPVVAEHNLFEQLKRGKKHEYRVALANAFPQRFFDYLDGHRRRMVAGIYAAMESNVLFRDVSHLKAGTAVSTDITAERWKEIGHPDAPVVTPHDAGMRLGHIAGEHDFTLYEYFATDKAGHERSMPHAAQVLQILDEFFHGLCTHLPPDVLLLITSDHGNMEELGTKSHTRNPVPLIAFGAANEFPLEKVGAITDIAPAIVHYLGEHRGE